jgi:hypothetical protein
MFGRYLERKQIESSGVENDSGEFRAGAKSVLEKLKHEHAGKFQKIWIWEEANTAIAIIMNEIENGYFSEKDLVQSWRKYRYIPIFIWMPQSETVAGENDVHFILKLVQKSLASAGMSFRDINYLKQLLDSGDFALLLAPLDVTNQLNALDQVLGGGPQSRGCGMFA